MTEGDILALQQLSLASKYLYQDLWSKYNFWLKLIFSFLFFPEVLFHKSGWLKVRSSPADCLQSKLSTKKPSKAKKTHLKTRFVFWGGKIQQNVISFILNAFLLSSIKCKMSTHYSELLAKWYFGRIRECFRASHRRTQKTTDGLQNKVWSLSIFTTLTANIFGSQVS